MIKRFLVIVLPFVSFLVFGEQNIRTKPDVILEEFGLYMRMGVHIHPCISKIEVRDNNFSFNDGFRDFLFTQYGITTVIDDGQLFFSCKDFMIAKELNSNINVDVIKSFVTPIITSKSIFSNKLTVSMPSKAWELDMGDLAESDIAPAKALYQAGDYSQLHSYQFKNRIFSESDISELESFLYNFGSRAVLYDPTSRTVMFNHSNGDEIIKNLRAIDIYTNEYKAKVVKLTINADSIDEFLYNIRAVESNALADICIDNCTQKVLLDYIENLQPFSRDHEFWSFKEHGLDLNVVETQYVLTSGQENAISHGKENYISNMSYNSDGDETVNVNKVASGFSIQSRLFELEDDKIHFSYLINDGEEDLTQLNQDLVSKANLSQQGNVILQIADEKLLFSRKDSKETERERVFPVFGYIPIIRILFNSLDVVYHEQYIYYFVKIDMD